MFVGITVIGVGAGLLFLTVPTKASLPTTEYEVTVEVLVIVLQDNTLATIFEMTGKKYSLSYRRDSSQKVGIAISNL